MGAVLSQEINGERKVIEFLSKSFTDTERRYSTIEKEATAILVALEKWQHYLLGREVTVETDHKPLIWLMSKKNCGGKLGRMALRLQEFHIKGIEHVKGEENLLADTLSRSVFDWFGSECTIRQAAVVNGERPESVQVDRQPRVPG